MFPNSLQTATQFAGQHNALLKAMLLASDETGWRIPKPILVAQASNPFAEFSPREFVIYPTSAVIAVSVVTSETSTAGATVVGWDGSLGMATSPNAPFRYSYHTVQSGYVTPIPISVVRDLLRNANVSRVLLNYLSFTINNLCTTPYCVSRHSVRERVASWIAAVYLRSPLKEISVTHEFLGNFLCIRRASVTTCLNYLASAGVLELGRGSVTVKSAPKLLQASCSCCKADKLWLSEVRRSPDQHKDALPQIDEMCSLRVASMIR